MGDLQFYIVGYRCSDNGGMLTYAECVQLGYGTCGKTLDDAFNGAIILSHSHLKHALGEEGNESYSPFRPSECHIWELINPATMEPVRRLETDIEGKYKAVFLCYDRTDVKDPVTLVM